MKTNGNELTHRVVLANGPRLLRELFFRVLDRTGDLQVVREVSDLSTLPAAVEDSRAEWLIASLPAGDGIPDAANQLLADGLVVGVFAVADDGSRARFKWNGSVEKSLDGLSLAEMLDALRYPTMERRAAAALAELTVGGSVLPVARRNGTAPPAHCV